MKQQQRKNLLAAHRVIYKEAESVVQKTINDREKWWENLRMFQGELEYFKVILCRINNWLYVFPVFHKTLIFFVGINRVVSWSFEQQFVINTTSQCHCHKSLDLRYFTSQKYRNFLKCLVHNYWWHNSS